MNVKRFLAWNGHPQSLAISTGARSSRPHPSASRRRNPRSKPLRHFGESASTSLMIGDDVENDEFPSTTREWWKTTNDEAKSGAMPGVPFSSLGHLGIDWSLGFRHWSFSPADRGLPKHEFSAIPQGQLLLASLDMVCHRAILSL